MYSFLQSVVVLSCMSCLEVYQHNENPIPEVLYHNILLLIVFHIARR